MRITVVVPSYRSSATLARCLASVERQRRPADEVIVVDSSDDDTPALVRRGFPGVTLVHLAQQTLPGPARNEGVRRATGDVIALLDADCVADEGWLEAAEAALQGSEWAAVGGPLVNGTPTSVTGTIMYLSEFNEHHPAAPPREAAFIPTANLAWRSGWLRRFPYDSKNFPGEDVAQTARARAAGARLWFEPAMRVTHLNRTGWERVRHHHRRLGRATATTRRDDPSLRGAFLVDHPWAVPLAPVARYGLLLGRLARYGDVRHLAVALAAGPAYAVAAGEWTLGFWEGLRPDR